MTLAALVPWLITLCTALFAVLGFVYTRGIREGRLEKAAKDIEAAADDIKSISQMREALREVTNRQSKMYSDISGLKERASVLDVKKASRDDIPAFRSSHDLEKYK